MFGGFESQLGHGVVGGPLLSIAAEGRRSAAVALRILGGESVERLAVPPAQPERYIYDWRELHRWNIPERRLPPGSDVRFRPPSLWEAYRRPLVAGLLLVGLEALLIGALLAQRARRHRAEEQVRALNRRLLTAQEDERKVLARELHDDFSQRLARLSIDAARLDDAAAIPLDGARHAPMREELARLSEDVHALAYQLHPSTLDDLGLIEALKIEADHFSRLESIPVRLDLGQPPPEPSREAALCLFRVAQEGLRNVKRHARARTVDLACAADGRGTRMILRDDGAGFDPVADPPPEPRAGGHARARGARRRAHRDPERARPRDHHRGLGAGRRRARVKRARVLLADDHRMVAEGLKSLLSPEFDLVGIVEDGRALVDEARRLKPDVIVADITMPRLNGLEAMALLRKDNPSVRVVVITMHRESAYARQSARGRRVGLRAEALGADRAHRGDPRGDGGQDVRHAGARGQRGAGRRRRCRPDTDGAPARDPAAARPRQDGQGDRFPARRLGAHGRVPQVQDDGGRRRRQQRRAHPLRDRARHRRAVAARRPHRRGRILGGARARRPFETPAGLTLHHAGDVSSAGPHPQKTRAGPMRLRNSASFTGAILALLCASPLLAQPKLDKNAYFGEMPDGRRHELVARRRSPSGTP